MKKKNIDKKVALSIGGLSVLCLGLLFGAWYLNHEPEESFTIGDTTNKDEVPSYPEEVPVTAPEVQVPADNSESSHPGQVYDPVFGWIDTGNTTYDVVDSDGDINKQIGSMGE